MKTDISALSEKELLALRGAIDKSLAKIEKKRKSEARKAIAAEARKYGFSLNELIGGSDKVAAAPKAAAKAKKPAPPKYRDPANSKNTWSGKGRPPQWFKIALEAGANPKSLEI